MMARRESAIVDEMIRNFRCLRCGGPVKNVNKNVRYTIDQRKYCSVECRCWTADIDEEIRNFKCLRCGGSIKTINKNTRYTIGRRKYCSSQCNGSFKRVVSTKFNCRNCGKIFWRKLYKGTRQNRIYCTASCSIRHTRRYPKEERKIREKFSNGTSLRPQDVPSDLVKVKMLQLQLKREAKEAFNG